MILCSSSCFFSDSSSTFSPGNLYMLSIYMHAGMLFLNG